MKVVLLVLMIAAGVFAGNYPVWVTDQLVIANDSILGTKYAQGLKNTGGVKWTVTAKANDSTTGFKQDSLKFFVGYRRGSVVVDANGTNQQIWGTGTIIDTFKLRADTCNVDTTNLPGFAFTTASVPSDTSQYLGLYITTITGNRVTRASGNVYLEVKRAIFKDED